jgi:EF-hand domain pair
MKTTFKPFTHIALAAALCVTVASSFAQAEQGKRSDMRKLDTNGDKLISRDEAKANPMLSKNFDVIDVNKDGQLSRDEIKAFHKAHKIDQDGDGNISRAEAAKNPKLTKHFDEIDTNKDGVITPAERKAWMDKRKKV